MHLVYSGYCVVSCAALQRNETLSPKLCTDLLEIMGILLNARHTWLDFLPLEQIK